MRAGCKQLLKFLNENRFIKCLNRSPLLAFDPTGKGHNYINNNITVLDSYHCNKSLYTYKHTHIAKQNQYAQHALFDGNPFAGLRALQGEHWPVYTTNIQINTNWSSPAARTLTRSYTKNQCAMYIWKAPLAFNQFYYKANQLLSGLRWVPVSVL